MKALLMHVAADTSNKGTVGINGPIFNNNHFEFIPIRESKKTTTKESRTYESLKSRNQNFTKYISELVPSDIKNDLVHYDPNFDNFTYSDPYETKKSKRGSQLRKLSPGDFIIFVASLAPFKKEIYKNSNRRIIRKYQKGRMKKCIIGYFEIVKILSLKKKTYNKHKVIGNEKNISKYMHQIKQNAHYKRKKDKFTIVIGKKNRKSALLSKAVPLTHTGAPFKPNNFAKKVYGNKSFPRGFKWIRDESRIKLLLKKIKTNN